MTREVELANVEVDGGKSWSLCFEAFGAPEAREEALEVVSNQFFAERAIQHWIRARHCRIRDGSAVWPFREPTERSTGNQQRRPLLARTDVMSESHRVKMAGA